LEIRKPQLLSLVPAGPLNMRPFERFEPLAPDELALLNDKRFTSGCLSTASVVLVIALIPVLWVLIPDIINGHTYAIVFLSGAIILVALLIYSFFWFKKVNNEPIDSDIRGGRKKVVVSPIESKRVDSTFNRHGNRGHGEVKMFYFMTVAGKEYKMPEEDYLKIRAGEFMEIHQAPNSGVIFRQEWIKKEAYNENPLNE